jgi:hypothetical protein
MLSSSADPDWPHPILVLSSALIRQKIQILISHMNASVRIQKHIEGDNERFIKG